jgi:hypothetical protein
MTVTHLHNSRSPIDRAEIHAIVDKLCDLRDLTSPEDCSDPDELRQGDLRGKDELATWAVFLANQIAVELAGWAINHVIGREVGNEDLSPNSHQHEKLAAFYMAGKEARLDRAVFIALIERQSQTIPVDLWCTVRDALQALSLGEIQPFARAEVTGRHHRPFSLAKARLRAVEYMHFLIGQGRKRLVAEEIVAKAYGVSVHTLTSWETRYLPETLGRKELARTVDGGRRAGEVHRILEADPDYANHRKGRTETLDGTGWSVRRILLGKSLAEIGRDYQNLLRDADRGS